MFDRFRQDDSSTTRKYGGLGLGLSIVKHLVELHGGSVRASSAGLDLGATVTILLPIITIHEVEPTGKMMHSVRPLSLEEINSRVPALNDLVGLVVDDEPDSREVVKRILEDHKATVFTAGSVDNALDILARENVNLLISDIGMPEKDGYELMRTIRSSEQSRLSKLPAIALTAFARSEERTRSALAGFNSHLAKPAEPAELIAVVASLALFSGK